LLEFYLLYLLDAEEEAESQKMQYRTILVLTQTAFPNARTSSAETTDAAANAEHAQKAKHAVLRDSVFQKFHAVRQKTNPGALPTAR
jgi:hypothetical protein